MPEDSKLKKYMDNIRAFGRAYHDYQLSHGGNGFGPLPMMGAMSATSRASSPAFGWQIDKAVDRRRSAFDLAREGKITADRARQLEAQNHEALRRGQRDRERAAYERLIPSGRLSDVAGKIWAAPITAVGALAGLASVGAAKLAGHDDARITPGNNAIQFEGGLFGVPGAFTMGNSVIYGPGSHPDDPSRKRYDDV